MLSWTDFGVSRSFPHSGCLTMAASGSWPSIPSGCLPLSALACFLSMLLSSLIHCFSMPAFKLSKRQDPSDRVHGCICCFSVFSAGPILMTNIHLLPWRFCLEKPAFRPVVLWNLLWLAINSEGTMNLGAGLQKVTQGSWSPYGVVTSHNMWCFNQVVPASISSPDLLPERLDEATQTLTRCHSAALPGTHQPGGFYTTVLKLQQCFHAERQREPWDVIFVIYNLLHSCVSLHRGWSWPSFLLWALGNVLPPLEAENHHLPPSCPEDRSCSTAVTADRAAVGMEAQGLSCGWMDVESKRNKEHWWLNSNPCEVRRLPSFLPNQLVELLKSVCIRTLEIFKCAQMTMSFSLQKALGTWTFHSQ